MPFTPQHWFKSLSIHGGAFSGYLGVSIFFVVSSYLITRSLIQEEEKIGSISLNFFLHKACITIFTCTMAMYISCLDFKDVIMKLEKTLMKLCPKHLRLPVKYHYHKIRNRLEKEIYYIDQLVGHCKRAIDIGANEGMYSYALSQICNDVEVFEPQYWCTENLISYSKESTCNITVYNVGLANFNGSLTLHVPTSQGDYSQLVRGVGSLTTGLGSFRNLEGEQITINVPVGKLDDYEFQDVSFIKIDVEGYETKVIEGASSTIIREKPIILIEVEQRHLDGKSIEDVFTQITKFGYEGSFLDEGCFTPISKFNNQIQEKQNYFLEELFPNKYINNFIFKPAA